MASRKFSYTVSKREYNSVRNFNVTQGSLAAPLAHAVGRESVGAASTLELSATTQLFCCCCCVSCVVGYATATIFKCADTQKLARETCVLERGSMGPPPSPVGATEAQQVTCGAAVGRTLGLCLQTMQDSRKERKRRGAEDIEDAHEWCVVNQLGHLSPESAAPPARPPDMSFYHCAGLHKVLSLRCACSPRCFGSGDARLKDCALRPYNVYTWTSRGGNSVQAQLMVQSVDPESTRTTSAPTISLGQSCSSLGPFRGFFFVTIIAVT